MTPYGQQMRAPTTTGACRRHAPEASLRPGALRVAATVGVWTTAIVAAHLALAQEPLGEAPDLELRAPPLHGMFGVRVDASVLFALAVGGLLVLAGPVAARRAHWRWLLVGGAAAAAMWAVALALADGTDGLLRGVLGPTEYLADVRRVRDVGDLLTRYPDLVRARALSAHSSGHPPGPLLALVGLHRLGLGGPEPAAALFVIGGAAAVPAVLVAARETAGEAFARRAAPYVALAPCALWIATSADALFAGVAAWAATAVVLATGRAGRRADLLAIAGGLGFGVALNLSYGLGLVALIPLVVAVSRRRVRPLAVASVAALMVGLGFLAAGFSWVEGFTATRERYFAGIASERPYLTFLVVNLVVLALVVGPIGVFALTRLRARGAWLLVGAAAGAVAIADLSGMAKGEVERIWLPFALWLLLACGAIETSDRGARMMLAIQAVVCLVISTALVTAW
jgi:hypothetical protein